MTRPRSQRPLALPLAVSLLLVLPLAWAAGTGQTEYSGPTSVTVGQTGNLRLRCTGQVIAEGASGEFRCWTQRVSGVSVILQENWCNLVFLERVDGAGQDSITPTPYPVGPEGMGCLWSLPDNPQRFPPGSTWAYRTSMSADLRWSCEGTPRFCTEEWASGYVADGGPATPGDAHAITIHRCDSPECRVEIIID